MSHHAEQVAAALQRAVQTVLSRGLNDPRVRGLISVTKVEVTRDLAQASVFVSVHPAEHAELSLHGLRHATAHIRTRVGHEVRIRRMPRFVFRLDDSIKKQSGLLAALARAAEARGDDRAAAHDLPDPPTDPEVPSP